MSSPGLHAFLLPTDLLFWGPLVRGNDHRHLKSEFLHVEMSLTVASISPKLSWQQVEGDSAGRERKREMGRETLMMRYNY